MFAPVLATRSFIRSAANAVDDERRSQIAALTAQAWAEQAPHTDLAALFASTLGALDCESLCELAYALDCAPTASALQAEFDALTCPDDRREALAAAAGEAARQHHQETGDLELVLGRALPQLTTQTLGALTGAVTRLYAEQYAGSMN